MDLKNKKLLWVMSFKAPYGGNIIPSLLKLAARLRQEFETEVSWAFPAQESKEWLTSIESEYKVYYISEGKDEREIIRILREARPDIVHTHFGRYDLSVVTAIRELRLPTRIVWHLHSHLNPLRTKGEEVSPLRLLRRILSYIKVYKVYGRKVFKVAVSPEVAYYADYYHRRWSILPPPYISNEVMSQMHYKDCVVLINGIEISRINYQIERKDAVFTFMTFGGIQTVKRVDLLVRAAILLRQRGLTDFKLLITAGLGTRDMILKICCDRIPEWIELVEQTENISALFARSSCYVSTSLRETQSMAIAEATLMGLPVIQSDIPGTWWNARNPSTLLFRTCDVQDLADKMQLMLRVGRTPEWRERVEQTRRHNMQLLSIDRWTEEMINVYRQL